MPIENRNLEPGTRLVARYKKGVHHCEVVAGENGPRYRLEDGREFASLSAAGSAVMGGVACNGWRFWSVEGDEAATDVSAKDPPAGVTKGPTRASEAARLFKQIKRVPNQQGVPEGDVKWFCSGCQKSFLVEGTEVPETCPEGHPRVVEDRLVKS